MAIKFKYKIPDGLKPLVVETIPDYGSDYIYGLMPEELAGQLKHCSLYMVCEHENNDNGQIWKNPIVIVGMNMNNAIESYAEITGNGNGSILCEISNRCDNIKVERCD